MQATILVERKGGGVPSFHGRGFSPSVRTVGSQQKSMTHNMSSVSMLSSCEKHSRWYSFWADMKDLRYPM